MRTVIGWVAALLASALLGAAVYEVALSSPLPQTEIGASQAWATEAPADPPTIRRTITRTVVDPTPTVTVEVPVVVTRTQAPVTVVRRTTVQRVRRTATSTRTATKAAKSRSVNRDDDSDEHVDEADD